MRFYSFEVIFEKEAEDDGYFAWSPSLPGCVSNGQTIEETKRRMREAVTSHVESLLAHGEPVPKNERLVHVEELTIAVKPPPPGVRAGRSGSGEPPAECAPSAPSTGTG